ncbi:MAG: Gfo/Idh/MocA family oxidoreductase [Cyclobacteriaceae bacterium]|nr:Gfo/Idh/MocA family oxidoreductase [Cyclobacteriaceae bacterium]
MDRRNFIKAGSLTAAALISPFYTPVKAQDRKLKIGLIGSGWYGMVITNAAFKSGGIEVIGVCDVDTDHLNKATDEIETLQGSRPEGFKNYQELIGMKGLEAVLIATPPHWHALQFIAACEKGVHIYCEKPLAYDVNEGLSMVKAAEKAGNIVQIGFQRRQSKAFQKAGELIRNGEAGNIHQIDARIHYNPVLQDTTIQPPPDSLDWDAWCGPAPKLEYRPNIGHMAWRLEKEYGNGHLVDWGIHHIDIIRKIMDYDMPSGFRSTGGLMVLKDKITTPDTLTAIMHFDQAQVTWEHRLWGSGSLNTRYNNGIFFYGDRATLFADDRNVLIMPSGRDQEMKSMDIPTEGMQENHLSDFLNAVRKKDKNLISCSVEDAFKSTATVQLAMISYYTGSEIKWDKQNLRITGSKEAAKLMARKYREGYKRPEI